MPTANIDSMNMAPDAEEKELFLPYKRTTFNRNAYKNNRSYREPIKLLNVIIFKQTLQIIQPCLFLGQAFDISTDSKSLIF